MNKLSITASIITTLSVIIPSVYAQNDASNTPTHLTDLIGIRGSSGETQLQQRGYEWRNTNKEGNNAYSYWFNKPAISCIEVTTTQGNYQAITETNIQNCLDASCPEIEPSKELVGEKINIVLPCLEQAGWQINSQRENLILLDRNQLGMDITYNQEGTIIKIEVIRLT